MSLLNHLLSWLWTGSPALYQYSASDLEDGPTLRRGPYKRAPSVCDAEHGPARDTERDRKRIEDLTERNARLVQTQAGLAQELDAARATLVGATADAADAQERATELAARNTALIGELDAAYAAVRTQHVELARFRGENDALRVERAHSAHALEERTQEVRSLQSFLTKTDGWSGSEVIQAVEDLNAEIVQLAAGVADALAGAPDRKLWEATEGHRALVGGVLGEPMLRMLSTRDHSADGLVVQLALQAWAVHCCSRILDAFCTGLPRIVDEFLVRLFDRMHQLEPQPTSARWRSLAHQHAREILGPAAGSLDAHAFYHARGAAAVLALAGYAAPELSERHTANIRRLAERALALRRALSEDVMSACFAVVGGAALAEFDEAREEDMFYGLSPPGPASVLCVTAFGVACERRIEDVKDAVLERTVLLKPKVLLTSVETLL